VDDVVHRGYGVSQSVSAGELKPVNSCGAVVR